MSEDYPLVAIVGPTGAGKSALALSLAESFDGEIINYDSVQVYQGFDIGSGKLSVEARRGVPHHLLDCRRPAELFSAGDYRRDAVRVLAEIRKRAKLPILVGGTGLYLRALLLGLFDGPQRSEVLRTRLRSAAKRRGHEFLHRMLGRLDPASAGRIHSHDTQKVVRALEVCILRRAPFSDELARGRSALAGYRTIKVGLNPYRKKLAERINDRVEQMFAGGLLEEARSLLVRFDAARPKPLQALGYRQACAALRREITIEEAVRETQAATRQYAKRQMTWFRRERDVKWFDGFGDDPVIASAVTRWLHPLVREGRSPGPEASTGASKDQNEASRKREDMEKQPQNIQDGFLNSARKEKAMVAVYLTSGVKLTGRIRSFDKYCVVLESNNQEQLIFKHAISTVALQRASAAAPHTAAPEG